MDNSADADQMSPDVSSLLKGTATLMIIMFYMKDLNKTLILIPVWYQIGWKM